MPQKTIIFHNPSCSKSCETLDLLQNSSAEFEIVEYLKDTPTKEDLKKIVSLLGIKAEDLIRKNEEDFIANYADKELTEDEALEAMVKFPILIERPIVIQGNKAIIGRPPRLVLDII